MRRVGGENCAPLFNSLPDPQDPSLDTLPLVYVEEEQLPTALAGDDYAELDNSIGSLVLGPNKPKRSRYYRRYPWKRHNRNRG